MRMRILGIDYGSKRVGVAISDPTEKFALPLSVISASPTLAEEVSKIALDNEAKEIVIGESRQYDMSANKILPAIMAFKEKLDDAGFRTILELEFMTSAQAERLQGKNDMTDASAAALILQAFLDRRANEKE
jgi:putative Holliday junction resolvase